MQKKINLTLKKKKNAEWMHKFDNYKNRGEIDVYNKWTEIHYWPPFQQC